MQLNEAYALNETIEINVDGTGFSSTSFLRIKNYLLGKFEGLVSLIETKQNQAC